MNTATSKQPDRARAEYGVVTGPGTVRFERLLPGPVERIWAYLTESEKRRKWLASGEMEPRLGGRVELTFNNSELSAHIEQTPEKYKQYEGVSFTGRITRYEEPRVLSYTWGGEPGEESEVTFELIPQDHDVLLVLTHRRLGDREAMVSVSGGWHTHLDVLRDNLEGREPRPFWSTHADLESEYERRIGPAGQA